MMRFPLVVRKRGPRNAAHGRTAISRKAGIVFIQRKFRMDRINARVHDEGAGDASGGSCWGSPLPVGTTQEPGFHGYTLLLSAPVRPIRCRPGRRVPVLWQRRRTGSRARVRGRQRRNDGVGRLRAMPAHLAGEVCAGRLFGTRTASDLARLRPKATPGAMPEEVPRIIPIQRVARSRSTHPEQRKRGAMHHDRERWNALKRTERNILVLFVGFLPFAGISGWLVSRFTEAEWVVFIPASGWGGSICYQ